MPYQEDFIARQPYGKAALKKLAPTSKDFRLYCVSWLAGQNVVKVTGAEFRAVRTGSDSGKLFVMAEGSRRTVLVSLDEIG